MSAPEITSGSNPVQFCQGYSDPAADLVLVSEEGTNLRVHFSQLETYSAVFRNMFQLLQSITSQDTHEDVLIPCSTTDLRFFLDILYTGSIPLDLSVNNYKELLRLSEEFDCERHHALILNSIHGLAERRPWFVFCVASHCNDIDLGRMAITQMDEELETMLPALPNSPEARDFISPLELFTIEMASQCTLPYFLALVAAIGRYHVGREGIRGGDWDWEIVSEIFSPSQ